MGPMKGIKPLSKMKKGKSSPAVKAAKKAGVKKLSPKAGRLKPAAYKV